MEGLADFLSSLGVEYDGRNFSSFDWVENEETCNLLHEKAFEIIEAINRRKEESKNERIGDFRSTFALAMTWAANGWPMSLENTSKPKVYDEECWLIHEKNG